jgi:hypothetical protein
MRAAGRADPIRRVDDWVRERIAAPHPELGRSGDVCPFVAASFNNDGLRYAVVPGDDLSAATVTAVVASLGTHFDHVRRQSSRPHLQTFITLFPGMTDEALTPIILSVHHTLKDSFVRAHRMLGEFMPDYESPGIHNPHFRPLTSPVPLLVIRSMVANDSIFLDSHDDWLREHSRLSTTGRPHQRAGTLS